MSYLAQAELRVDGPLQARTVACVFEQATIYTDDGRPDIAALADLHLRDSTTVLGVWMPFVAAAPGFADHESSEDITDADLLAAVQADWPKVASVFYNADGTPIATEG